TNLVDRFVEAVVEIDEGVGAPELLPDFVTGDRFAAPLDEQRQHLKRLCLKSDPGSAFPQFAASKVHFEDAETDAAVNACLLHRTLSIRSSLPSRRPARLREQSVSQVA